MTQHKNTQTRLSRLEQVLAKIETRLYSRMETNTVTTEETDRYLRVSYAYRTEKYKPAA